MKDVRALDDYAVVSLAHSQIMVMTSDPMELKGERAEPESLDTQKHLRHRDRGGRLSRHATC